MRYLSLAIAVFLLALLTGCEDYNRDLRETDRGTAPSPAETPPMEPPQRDATTPPSRDGMDMNRDRDMDMPRDDSSITPPAVPPAGAGNDAAAGNLTPQDREFITKAISGGEYEVQSSQMALDHGLDAQTQGVAQMIVRDHTAANEELKALAMRKGVPVSPSIDEKHQDMLDELKQASGDDFAAKYREQQVAAHEEAISLFEEYASTTKDADLKAFIEKTLPTLRAHLEHLKQTEPQPGS